MEDILASIRRIIADDQLQSQRPGYGGPRRTGPGQGPAETGSSQRMQDARGGNDEVLDLARLRGTAQPEREAARPAAERREPVTTVFPAAATSVASPRGAPSSAASWPTDHRPGPAAEPQYEEPAIGDDEADAGEAFFRDDAAYAHAEPAEVAEPAQGRSLSTERHGQGQPARTSMTGDALISAKPGAAVMSAFETLAATVVLQNGEMLERIMRDELRPMIKTWLDDNLPTMVEGLVRSEIERVARGGRG